MAFRKYRFLTLLFSVACLMAADAVMAQPGRGRGGPPGGDRGRGGFFETGSIDLLRNEKVQGELDMVDEQVEAIAAISEEMSQEQREFFSSMRDRFRDLNDEERRGMFDQLRKEVGEMRAKFNKRAEEELLPVQVERLKQLVVQMQQRRNGGAERGALSAGLAEQLGLSDEQKEELRAAAEKFGPELQKKIAKLRAETTEQILSSVLTDEQLAQYKEIVGDQFDFGEPRRGGFGGRPGGDRGGDRGDRGGRGRGPRPGADRGGEDFE